MAIVWQRRIYSMTNVGLIIAIHIITGYIFLLLVRITN